MNIRKRDRYEYILLATTLVYSIVMIIFLFMRRGALQTVNLTPLRFIADFIVGDGVLPVANILGNVLLFFPLGMLLAHWRPQNGLLLNLAIVFLFSTLIEALQFLFSAGVTDIDDIILNTIGGVLGIGFYCLLHRRLGERTCRVFAVNFATLLFLFILLVLCLYYGIFGIRIRIL